MTNGINVTKVIGGPGTGKTTYMVGNPELEMDGLFVENAERYDFDEQMLVTYTNAGVDEAVDRLRVLLDLTKKRTEERVMTIHGFCLRRSEEITFPQIIDWRDEQEFCREFNLDYGNDDDDDDLMAGGGDAEEGNVLWQIYNWLRSNRYSMEEYDKCPVEWPSDRKLPGLLAAIEEWKDRKNKYVWADLIENNVQRNLDVLREAGLGDTDIEDDWEYADSVRQDPDIADKQEAMRGEFGFADTKVLYVDEAQDMTTLQFLWYKLQKLIADEVYIGGDDDQTIYGWSGADAEYLLNEEGETEVLEKTYRIPEQVWQACEANITQVEHRQDKEIEPVDSEGEVVTYKNPHSSQLAKHIRDSDDVLILFRARYQIDEFRDELHDLGIPYENMSTFPTWKQQVTRLRDSLKHVKGGGTIPEDDAVRIIESAEKKMLKSGSPGLAEYSVEDDIEFEDLKDRFTYDAYSPSAFLNWYTEQLYDIDDGMLNWFQKEAVKGNIMNGDTERDPSSVRIGTIHSAKGKEADTVILGTDSTQTIMENMMEDEMEEIPEDPYGRPMLDGSYISDDERRVMYVGMSRAERKLVLAEGAVTPDTALSIKSLVSNDS